MNYDVDNYDWNNEPAPLGIKSNDPHFDPAYIHYLDENEHGLPQRPRVAEVGVFTIVLVFYGLNNHVAG